MSCFTSGPSETQRCYTWGLNGPQQSADGKTPINNADWQALISEMSTQIAEVHGECVKGARAWLDTQRGDSRFGVMSDFQKAKDTFSNSLLNAMTVGLITEGTVSVLSVSAAEASGMTLAQLLRSVIQNVTTKSAFAGAVTVIAYSAGAYLLELQGLRSQYNRDFGDPFSPSLSASETWYASINPTFDLKLRNCESQKANFITWRMGYLNNNYFQVP